MIVFWACSQLHNIIWALFKQSEDMKELQSLHPQQPMMVWHFCSYCALFLSATCVGVGAWSVHKVVINRGRGINLPKMKITFYLGAGSDPASAKNTRKSSQFSQCCPMFCSHYQHFTLSATAAWPGELTSPFRMPK